MNLLKYSITTFLLFSMINEVKSQIIINAWEDSCILVKDVGYDTFMIYLKSEIKLSNDDTLSKKFYNIGIFKKNLAEILNVDDSNSVARFLQLDTLKLKPIIDKINGREKFFYSINKRTFVPNGGDMGDKSGTSINKNWFFLLLILIPIIAFVFRKKLGVKLIKRDIVAPKDSIGYEIFNENESKLEKVKAENNRLKKEIEQKITEEEKSIKEFKSRLNDYNGKIAKLEKENNNLNIQVANFENELAERIEAMKSKIELKIRKLDEDLIKSKEEISDLNISNREKLKPIIEEAKRFEDCISKIFKKYEFLIDDRKYNDKFDLGQFVEVAYLFSAINRIYLSKLPELFSSLENSSFTNNIQLTQSDFLNEEFVMNNIIDESPLLVDDDSVKRNLDISIYIKNLRKLLKEANVKDISNVVIKNHRIKL